MPAIADFELRPTRELVNRLMASGGDAKTIFKFLLAALDRIDGRLDFVSEVLAELIERVQAMEKAAKPKDEIQFFKDTSLVCPSCGYRKVQVWRNSDGSFFCRCADCDVFGSDSEDEDGAELNFRYS